VFVCRDVSLPVPGYISYDSTAIFTELDTQVGISPGKNWLGFQGHRSKVKVMQRQTWKPLNRIDQEPLTGSERRLWQINILIGRRRITFSRSLAQRSRLIDLVLLFI